MATEQSVREAVYRSTVEHGRPPRIADLASALGVSRGEVVETFRQLASRRLLALAPESGEIVMAPPFSANPTPFRVLVGESSYFANCVWDAYGVAAALHRDADIEASCACCGEPMSLAVREGRPVPTDGVAHFAVPAAGWWDDITYT
jgi:DNA-binding FadR family transcriptional regulator